MKAQIKMQGIVGLLFIILFVVTGCSSGKETSSNSAQSKEPFKIGALLSITGPNSPLGESEKKAVELQVKKINESGGVNGRPLEVFFEDDKSDNTEAVKAVKKLITKDHVIAILGSSGSGTSLAMAEVANQEHVTMISMAGAYQITTPVRPDIFKTAHTDVHSSKRIYKYFQNKGISKVGILYDSNPYGSGFAEQLNKFAPEYKMSIVAQEKYGTKDTSMSTQLTKIKSSEVQAIVVAGTNPGPAIISKEAKQLGISIPLIFTHGSANHKFVELAGEAANGNLLVAEKILIPAVLKEKDPQQKIVQNFAKDFKADYGSDPDAFAGYAYDAVNILAEGLKAAQGNPEKLSQSIEAVKYVGVTGSFSFSGEDHTGLTEDDMVIVEVKDGQFAFVD